MKVYDIVVRTTAGVFEFTNAILEDCYGDNEFLTVVDSVGRTSFNRDHVIFFSQIENRGIGPEYWENRDER